MAAAGYPSHPIPAVAAVVIREDRVLLVQRRQPPGAGDWAVPGGKIRLGETLQCAAEREVFEETGVVIRALEPIYAFDHVEWDPDDRVRFHYVIIDLSAQWLKGEPIPDTDACAARWCACHELDGLELSAKTRKLLREIGFTR